MKKLTNPPAAIVATEAQPALFEDHQIRRAMHDGTWQWAIVDIIKALTGTTRPRKYWSDLKRRIAAEGGSQLSAKIGQLKLRSSDGKEYLTDTADLETVFRIIQSVPSPKAEPFKRWLAKVGSERVQEEADPGITLDRAIRKFKAKGWSDAKIKARVDGTLTRNTLTDEWQARGVTQGWQYGDLTNRIYRGTFNLDKKGLCDVKGLKEAANLRNSMSAIELSLVNLGETVATELARQRDAQGYYGCRTAADDAGAVAGNARRDIEKRLGSSIITTADQGDMPLLAGNSNKRRKAS